MIEEKKEFIEFKCPPSCGRMLCRYIEKPSNEPYAFEIKCHHHGCNALNYRGNVIVTDSMEEFRCYAIDKKKSVHWGAETVCNKLLARILPGTELEIRCPRCGAIVNSNEADIKTPESVEAEK